MAKRSKVVFTLIAGGVGGSIMFALGAPLAWLVGAFVISTVLALSGFQPFVPTPLRHMALSVVGLFIGLGFEQATFSQLNQWSLSISLLATSTVVTTVLVYWLLVRLMSSKWQTVLFCSFPGGIAEMVSISQECKGDDKAVALIHLSRIVVTVSSLPFILPLFGIVPAALPVWTESDTLSTAIPSLEVIVTLCSALVLGYLLNRVSLPAAYIMGALLVGASLKVFAGIEPEMPTWTLPLAQIVIGCYIGCRFAKYRLFQIYKTFAIGSGVTLVMLAISALFAYIGSLFLDRDFATLLLAYVPGGLSEIALIAVTLSSDATFVALHHLVRIVFVIFAVSFTLAIIRRKQIKNT